MGLMVKLGPFPPFPLRVLLPYPAWFSAACSPLYIQRTLPSAVIRHVPATRHPATLPSSTRIPWRLSPDSPMNFPVRPDTFCRLLQLTDGLSPQPTHVRSVQSFLLSRSPVVYRPSFPLLSAE